MRRATAVCVASAGVVALLLAVGLWVVVVCSAAVLSGWVSSAPGHLFTVAHTISCHPTGSPVAVGEGGGCVARPTAGDLWQLPRIRAGVGGGPGRPERSIPGLDNSAVGPTELSADRWAGGLVRLNPRTSEQAMAWARGQVEHPTASWHHRCLNFVAQAYGWREAGVHRAIEHFRIQPRVMRFAGDRNPPPGALLFWRTGHRSGHVALSLGGGLIASNDILRAGRIDIVEADAPELMWGAQYLGWTMPYFPYGEGPSSTDPGPLPPITLEASGATPNKYPGSI